MIVPFYGHGMNAGFEDITILNELMQQYGDDWDRIFKAYEISRKKKKKIFQMQMPFAELSEEILKK